MTFRYLIIQEIALGLVSAKWHSRFVLAIILFLLSLLISPQCVIAEGTAGDSGYLRLVNRDYKLRSDYKPVNLVDYGGIKLHSAALNAFLQMQEAMKTDRIYNLRLQSAYRAYDYQYAIFSRKVQELQAKGYSKLEAERKASLSIHPPGASEHQLGLALDVSIDGKLTQAFGETSAGKWLEEHSHNYGFIIRYPNSKTDITKIVYEPWHLRYVGVPHATIIKDLELSLEEYLLWIKQVQMYIFWGEDREYYLLHYSKDLPPALLPGIIDVSSINPNENEYIVTMRKIYPNV